MSFGGDWGEEGFCDAGRGVSRLERGVRGEGREIVGCERGGGIVGNGGRDVCEEKK